MELVVLDWSQTGWLESDPWQGHWNFSLQHRECL